MIQKWFFVMFVGFSLGFILTLVGSPKYGINQEFLGYIGAIFWAMGAIGFWNLIKLDKREKLESPVFLVDNSGRVSKIWDKEKQEWK